MSSHTTGPITPQLPLHYEKHMDERHADLKSRVDSLERNCEDKFTKKYHFYMILGVSLFAVSGTLCAAYYKVNPSEIKAETSNVEYKLDKILETLGSK